MAPSTLEMTALKQRLFEDAQMTVGHAQGKAEAILQQEKDVIFPSFNADDAWSLCNSLRDILVHFRLAAVVSITLASNLVLAQAITTGTNPIDDAEASRKKDTVLKYGHSTMYVGLLNNRWKADSRGNANEYNMHDGGFPVRVKGVEGVVGVIVVSMQSGEQGHQLVYKVLGAYLRDMAVSERSEKGNGWTGEGFAFAIRAFVKDRDGKGHWDSKQPAGQLGWSGESIQETLDRGTSRVV